MTSQGIGKRVPIIVLFAMLALTIKPGRAFAEDLITVETEHGATQSAIVDHANVDSRARTLDTMKHRADNAPLATVSDDGRHIALLNIGESGEPRRHADLVVLDTHTNSHRVLATGLQQVPAAFAANRREVFVVRSSALPPPSVEERRHGHLENERLAVLAINLQNGHERVVVEDIAYMIHPVGVAASGELIVIRAAWEGGSIVAIHPTTGHLRTLVASPTDAYRDATLSTDRRSIVALARAGSTAKIIRVHVVNSAVEILVPNAAQDASPVALGNAAILFSEEHTRVAMRGTGNPAVVLEDKNASWVHAARASASGNHIVFEALTATGPKLIALNTHTGAYSVLAVPANTVVHVVGFSEVPQ